MRRGEVVLALIPYLDDSGGKRRPVLIVQADRYNQILRQTIVAAITSQIQFPGDPSRLLIDPATPAGSSSGLRQPSLLRCDRLFTLDMTSIGRIIGNLSPNVMTLVDDCLKAALGLP